MNKKTLEEINKFTNPDTCLFIGSKGLFRINTPFKVISICKIKEIKPGSILQVGKVKCSKDSRIIYIIDERPYHHRYFELIY
jgi:hypothetical protein